MKFPSIQNLFDSFKYVLKRFPFEMFFALTGTIAAIVNVETQQVNYIAENWCVRLIMVANLGLLISLATTLLCESKRIEKQQRLVFKLIAAVLAASLLFVINPLENSADYIRFFLLSLSAHLLVAFAAYTPGGLIQGFWQFNKTLFLRFLTSVLYSAALFLGIAAALGSMNVLFNADFNSDAFFILWICIAGMFNTLFFLAGVPADLHGLDQDFSYPKGLKIFTQYVLIPLATIYVVILLAYEIKILIEWDLPKGMVSNLILGYAVFGLLSILLVFPIKDQEENKWIKTYARSFYFLLLPLIVLLFLAVGTRIFNYGITEYRYFLILLSFWLLFITLYFLFSAKQNIKLIPISLCLLTLAAIYGPQSAFSVSRYSQTRILLNILNNNHALKNDNIVPVKKITEKEGQRAVATIEYLVDHYGIEVLQPYIKTDLAAVNDSISKNNNETRYDYATRYELRSARIKWIADYLNLTKYSGYRYMPYPGSGKNTQYISLSNGENDITKVSGYDYIIKDIDIYDGREGFMFDKVKVKTGVVHSEIHTLTLNDQTVRFDMKALINPLLKNEQQLKRYAEQATQTGEMSYNLSPEMLSFKKETKSFIIIFKVNMLRIAVNKNRTIDDISSIDGMYLVKKK